LVKLGIGEGVVFPEVIDTLYVETADEDVTDGEQDEKLRSKAAINPNRRNIPILITNLATILCRSALSYFIDNWTNFPINHSKLPP
jgi:hypothetical protein